MIPRVSIQDKVDQLWKECWERRKRLEDNPGVRTAVRELVNGYVLGLKIEDAQGRGLVNGEMDLAQPHLLAELGRSLVYSTKRVFHYNGRHTP